MDRLDPQTTEKAMPPAAHGGVPTGRFDPWSFRDEAGVTGSELVGYKVEATDGDIGKIDEASYDVDSSHLVVDTGAWIFGKKVMLPAGVVNQIDHDDKKVHVDRSKDEIKHAPEYDADTHTDPAYRDKLGSYYGETYDPARPRL
jgi:hypothetical protein